MNKGLLPVVALLIWTAAGILGCPKASDEKSKEVAVKVGPVKINPHPANLENKTVLLRWNGKYNGDNFLNRVAELLITESKNVRIIKMWEIDRTTASISKTLEESEKITAKVIEQKPDIVIASQAD